VCVCVCVCVCVWCVGDRCWTHGLMHATTKLYHWPFSNF
jgi:hypothetical protein